MFFVEFILYTATIDIVQWYCVLCGVYCGYSNSRYSVMVLLCMEFIVVISIVDIVQWYCVVCGVYCGYSNSSYSAMVLCCVWSLLWLQQL